MKKALEVAGFACVGGTIYAFMGPIPGGDPTGWPTFWACAAGALAIIIYRKRLNKEPSK